MDKTLLRHFAARLLATVEGMLAAQLEPPVDLQRIEEQIHALRYAFYGPELLESLGLELDRIEPALRAELLRLAEENARLKTLLADSIPQIPISCEVWLRHPDGSSTLIFPGKEP